MLVGAAVRPAGADPLAFAWDPNHSEEGVLGYVVRIETSPGVVVLQQDVGLQTTFVYPDAVPGQLYFLSVAAYNAFGTGPYSGVVLAYSNAPPVLANPDNQTNSVGDVVAIQLSATDLYDTQTFTFGATGLPPGVALDPSTGLISGTLTAAGIYSVEATAFDGVLTGSRPFTWLVDGGPPTISITSPTSVGTYSTTSAAIDLAGVAADETALGTVTWTNDRGGSGTAVGTNTWNVTIPLATGANNIVVTATDAAGHSATATIVVTYSGPPPTVAIGVPTSAGTFTTSATTITMGGTASHTAGITSVTWANDRGGSGTATLNAAQGLAFWSVASVPLQPGLNVVTVTATIPGGLTGNVTLQATRNQTPTVTNPGTQVGFQGIGLARTVTAADPEGNALTWSATGLPPGLSIGALTGSIAGTPTALGSYSVVVRATDGVSTGQASFVWTIVSPIPGAATPLTPSGSTGTTTPSFSWSAEVAATYYALQIEDSASPTVMWYTPAQASCPTGSGTCTVAAPRALAAGLLRWKVLTFSPHGYGPWSGLKEATIDLADGATPTPLPSAPAGAIATRTPTYSWSAVAGATWYQLMVTDAAATTRMFWFDADAYSCPSSACAVTPTTSLAIGAAQWQIRAWRSTGAGAWSAALSFEAADSPPGKATLVSPSSPVPSNALTFTWNAVVGTSYYLLRAFDVSNVAIDRWYRPTQAGCPLGTGICSVSLSGVLNPGPANWQVLTWNGSGYGPWSDPFTFSVEIADPAAGVPQTVTPTGAISSPNVEYVWTAVAGAVAYRLSIANNGGPAAQWWFSPAAAGCLVAAECRVLPQVGLLAGTAVWQIQAWTANGYGDWSAPVSLTVTVPAPLAPTLISPSGSTTGSPTYTWNAVSGVVWYYLIASDQTGQRVARWLRPDQVGCGAGTGVCSFNAGVTLASGPGSWHVLAWNASGYSEWPPALSFVIP